MAAGKRNENESFKDYRRRLMKEKVIQKRAEQGTMIHQSTFYNFSGKDVNGIPHGMKLAPGKTYQTGVGA